ncbi:MAG: four helix bundle protein [Bacteroidota bacterium]
MVASFRELRVYRLAFEAATAIYEHSKRWPKEERYALTDQIRRPSRAVCANIAEAWYKRPYPKHFASKLTDAEAEAGETQAWLDFALNAHLIDREHYDRLNAQYDRVLGALVTMRRSAARWNPNSTVRDPEAPYGLDADDETEDTLPPPSSPHPLPR